MGTKVAPAFIIGLGDELLTSALNPPTDRSR